MKIDASDQGFKRLNETIRRADGDAEVVGVCGERFIAAGLEEKKIRITGTPGNALGAYLDGADVFVDGNGQDAVGDTMNRGRIAINGSVGDALGYAMRGGKIFIGGDAGYRCGVHIKEYKDNKPVIVIGGAAGSFLGEYMAGGRIIVLNLAEKNPPVGNFTGVGMHGGKIFIRAKTLDICLPSQVKCERAKNEDIEEINEYLKEFLSLFGKGKDEIFTDDYFVLKPDSSNPYKRLYTAN